MQPFPPSDLVLNAGLVLITDELPAPADFLLHRFLHAKIRDAKQPHCIFLSVSEDFDRIKAVASKANAKLKFIDFIKASEASPEKTTGVADTRLYNIINLLSLEIGAMKAAEGQTLVILDDIASLEWLGFSPLVLFRFARALKALCLKSWRNSSYPTSHPGCIGTWSPFRLLLQLCSYHIEVRPLASGRSGAVSGELCLHPGPCEREFKCRLLSRYKRRSAVVRP
ncbi:hypothetical protein EDD15DRAFT_1427071 [Pisolithus albus]|nr:hypothetical protein EDD15DRAFT_1427071 [Pisolithus albus]